MKKYILLFSLLSSVFYLSAQKENLPVIEDLNHFYKTKTYVVLEASPMSDYNFEIQNVMSRIWELTDFEFIKQEDFHEKSQDPDASFIYTSLVSFERDRTDSRYVFLHISLGGESLTMDDLRDLVSVPLGYAEVEPEKYIYKLGIILRFMQNHLQLITQNPDIISSNIFKYYNKNIQSAHDKTIYFLEDELEREIGTAARIKQIYPYRFRIVSREEIHQAIIDQDDDVVFLHKVGPEGKNKARCYKILIGAGDAEFYYFDYHMVSDKKPDGFLESDLKKLAK